MLKKLWRDEGGAILTTELILIIVITVIGMVVGLTALRDAVDAQLADLAGAIAAIDVGYQFDGLLYSASELGLSGASTMNAAVADSLYVASFNTAGTAGINMLTILTASQTKNSITGGP